MTVKSGKIDVERLQRGIRRDDANVLKSALAVIVLRQRHAMKKSKASRKKKQTALPSFHCLPLETRTDHLQNMFSMAENQHTKGNNNRAEAFLAHAACQLVQTEDESRAEWIYTFLKAKPLSEVSISLWGYILQAQPTLSHDIFAVAFQHCFDLEEIKPQWFLLVELCMPHTSTQILAQAWEQLTAATSVPMGPRSMFECTPNDYLVVRARAVLAELLHSLLWEENKQQNAWARFES